MPISDTRKWKVKKPADEILKIVSAKLAEKKATLLEANSRRIEATIGSEAKHVSWEEFSCPKKHFP